MILNHPRFKVNVSNGLNISILYLAVSTDRQASGGGGEVPGATADSVARQRGHPHAGLRDPLSTTEISYNAAGPEETPCH